MPELIRCKKRAEMAFQAQTQLAEKLQKVSPREQRRVDLIVKYFIQKIGKLVHSLKTFTYVNLDILKRN
jgi:hypothetical protein